jgi:hypothetical protein
METTTRSETSAGAGKPSLNPDALNQLLGQMVNDLGAAVNGALVVNQSGIPEPLDSPDEAAHHGVSSLDRSL